MLLRGGASDDRAVVLQLSSYIQAFLFLRQTRLAGGGTFSGRPFVSK